MPATAGGAYATRPQVLRRGVGLLPASVAVGVGCGDTQEDTMREKRTAPQAARAGVLTTRPQPVTAPAPAGQHALHLGQPRDGLLAVPARYHPTQPVPLALMLHGAGASAAPGLALLQPWAEAAGGLVLAPEARGATWGVLLGA